MKLKEIKEQKGTLRKLHNLLNDPSKKVHGVHYTNSYFSQRYLARSQVLVEDVDVNDNELKLTVATRLEQVGLMEIENTLDMLVKHKAGDIPGFSPEGIYEGGGGDEGADRPHIREIVSVRQHLFSVDVLLLIKDPTITYKDFSIAGYRFSLIKIHHTLEEGYDQTVTLLFGDADKLYFLSHFYDKELNLRDTKMVLDMIVDENITGKAITGINVRTTQGTSSSLYPVESLIGSYTNFNGDIIFNTQTGYISIPGDSIKEYRLSCEPNTSAGDYKLTLESKTDTITIYIE